MAFALVFVLWVGFGVWLWRNGVKLFSKLSAIPVSRRKLLGTLLLLCSAALLLGGLVLLASSNPKSGPSNIQWTIIAILGLVFVYAQTMAAAMLVSLGISRDSRHENSAPTKSEGLSE